MTTHRPLGALRLARLLVLAAAGCASSAPPPAESEPVTPAAFVASIADVAAGGNETLAETGLVLSKIAFRLVVGTETRAGGTVEILVLDGEASRRTETTFLQELTLEIPPTRPRRAAAMPLVPGTREFVDAAIATARDLARAAAAAGLPQRLSGMELTAKIERSRTLAGGIRATIPAWVKPSLGAEASRIARDENVVTLTFSPR